MNDAILATAERLRVLGGTEFVADLFSNYMSESVGQVEQIREALLTGDLDLAGNAAHKLKGSSAAIGAVQLALYCGAIGDTIRSGETMDLQKQIDVLLAEYERVRIAAARFI